MFKVFLYEKTLKYNAHVVYLSLKVFYVDISFMFLSSQLKSVIYRWITLKIY